MVSSYEKYQKRRLRSSYFSVVLSIAFVLLLLGTFGFLFLQSQKLSDYFKSNVTMSIFLKDQIGKEQIKSYQLALEQNRQVAKVVFTDKKAAATQLKTDLGSDFISFIGENPLKNVLDIQFKPTFVNPTNLYLFQKQQADNAFVYEVIYDKPLVSLLTNNIKKIGFWMMVVTGFFVLVAFVLINSTIRLSIYSKRFTIKTMQMVGATGSFIRWPFIWKGIQLGVIASIIAIAVLSAAIYYLGIYFKVDLLLSDLPILLQVFGGMILFAIFITWLSTFFATQRYLKIKTDHLYY